MPLSLIAVPSSDSLTSGLSLILSGPPNYILAYFMCQLNMINLLLLSPSDNNLLHCNSTVCIEFSEIIYNCFSDVNYLSPALLSPELAVLQQISHWKILHVLHVSWLILTPVLGVNKALTLLGLSSSPLSNLRLYLLRQQAQFCRFQYFPNLPGTQLYCELSFLV